MQRATGPVVHQSVLLEETIAILDPRSTDVIVDGTFGGGGHSRMVRERAPEAQLVCVDLDEDAQQRFAAAFGTDARARFVHANFKEAARILQEAGEAQADKVILDLGTSAFQLLADERGFSFQSDAPLSMTFSQAGSHTGFTAADIVGKWSAESIADIIYHYGEERQARKIAAAIVAARDMAPIDTSRRLAEVIESAARRRGRIHPATKTFQALRIAVNDELGVLKQALDAWLAALAPSGRIAVISFHSLEDRIVKHWARERAAQDTLRVITKKPIVPSRDAIRTNPKARSAKLRAIEKSSS